MHETAAALLMDGEWEIPLCCWATVCKTVRLMLAVSCLSVLSCLSVTLVYCGQTVGRIKMKLGMEVGLGPGHIVLGGDPAPPSPDGHSPPNSRPTCCDQMAAWIKMPLSMELGLGPGDFVLDGDLARPLNFRPMFIIVIVISLEHCTVVIGLIKFKF